jgi:hypothetical protein
MMLTISRPTIKPAPRRDQRREQIMTSLTTTIRRLAISGLVLAALPQAAFAQSTQEVTERIRTLLDEQGLKLSWTGVSETGGAIVLQGVSGAVEGLDGSAPIGDITLSDIGQDGDLITVGSVTMPGYSRTNEGVTVTIEDISISGLQLPPAGAADAMNSIMIYDSGDVGRITVSAAGREIVSIDQLHGESAQGDDGTFTFGGAVEGFSADLSLMEDPQSKAVIDALGYQTIKGYMEFSGTWNPTDGRMVLDQSDISINEAGTIGMTLDISGYTPQFMAALRDLQNKAATGGGDDAAQGMAMLGLMQQINLHSASMRFDDDSLTDKVLAFIASQQGAQPADIKNQAKAILPFALAQLGNPELTSAISRAVNAFLDNPESLEISVEPENPVPFALVAAGAMTAPQSLPQQLGFEIAANE